MTVTIVAELGSNWDPADPLNSSRQLIQAAAGAGANVVKMQDWYPLDDMNRDDAWKERCKPWTLAPGAIPALKWAAQKQHVEFLCSTFTIAAVTHAVQHRYPAIKIASSEIGNEELLTRLARLRFPVWLSTGGATYKDVERALDWMGRVVRRHTTLLHCVCEYPTPVEHAAMRRVANLAKRFTMPVGWSSHASYPDVVELAAEAVRAGATVIEAHFRVEGITPESAPDNGPWALYPQEFGELVGAVRDAER